MKRQLIVFGVLFATVATATPFTRFREPRDMGGAAAGPPIAQPAGAGQAVAQAYRDLSEIQGQAAELQKQLEPYREWNAAEDAVWRARYEHEQARRDLREAERQQDNFNPDDYGIAKSAAAAEAARLRGRVSDAERAVKDTDRALGEAQRQRNELEDKNFGDAKGKPAARAEIEKRFNDLNDQLTELEKAERAATERLERAKTAERAGQAGGGQAAAGKNPIDSRALDDARTSAGGNGVAALDDLARAIEDGDCNLQRFTRARDAAHATLAALLGVVQAGNQDLISASPSGVDSRGPHARARRSQCDRRGVESARGVLGASLRQTCGVRRSARRCRDAVPARSIAFDRGHASGGWSTGRVRARGSASPCAGCEKRASGRALTRGPTPATR
jgi:conjugal transfer/entry exclusion protein